MGSGIDTPSPTFFSGVRYRSPIAPFNKISRYFQNIAIFGRKPHGYLFKYPFPEKSILSAIFRR
ncbi:hypothetical protein C1H46_021188 [Malus baccata]|uniref:Uncharacterized protein n=1 Tax=Malus baccata TaxID=106549 RepID=A0A540M360_MALBA|nr:hypothetical protein C1H46_021188 [Malus baccata]